MKKAILIAALSLFTITAFGQSIKNNGKKDATITMKPGSEIKLQDTTRNYTLSEQTIIQISQLLSYGDNIAGNSDKISTRDYNAYHAAIAKVDSVLREQYLKWHPAKEKKGAGK